MIKQRDFEEILHGAIPSINSVLGSRSEREWAIIFFFYIVKLEAVWKSDNKDYLDEEVLHYDFTAWVSYMDRRRQGNEVASIFMNLENVARGCKKGRWFLLYLVPSYLAYRIVNYKIRRQLRNKVKSYAAATEQGVVKAFLHNLPQVYLEDYHFYNRFVYRVETPINPYKCRNCTGILYANRIPDLPIKFEQHGGYYGEIAAHSNYEVESGLADEYYTWGWKYNSKDIPYGSKRLGATESSFLALNAPPEKDKRIVFMPAMVERYYPAIRAFLAAYSVAEYHNIWIRKYQVKSIYSSEMYAWFDQKVLEYDLRVMGPASNLSALAQAEIVILLNHPSTTFLECIYLDKPCTAYLDGSMPLHPEYKDKIQYLIEYGVLHDSMSEMMEFISQLSNSSEWWAKLIADPRHIEFKNTYCRRIEKAVIV